jgi:hypothetical protein
MEYRRIKFEVRACGYPNRWEWAVHTGGRVHRTGEAIGRQQAVAAALGFIDEWLDKRSQAPSPVVQSNEGMSTTGGAAPAGSGGRRAVEQGGITPRPRGSRIDISG